MWQKYGISVPGVVWGTLLLGLGYFLVENFPNEVWLPLVVVVIGAILKYIELQTGKDLPDLPDIPEGAAAAPYLEQKQPNKWVRWLVG